MSGPPPAAHAAAQKLATSIKAPASPYLIRISSSCSLSLALATLAFEAGPIYGSAE